MTRVITNLVCTFSLSLNISSNYISAHRLFVFVDKLWMTVLIVHYATRLLARIHYFSEIWKREVSEAFCSGMFSVNLPRKEISGNLVVGFGNLKYVSVIMSILHTCIFDGELLRIYVGGV